MIVSSAFESPTVVVRLDEIAVVGGRPATLQRTTTPSATAPQPEPLDDGVAPPLVLRARAMGLDV
jgi:hypothetical protein